MQGAVRPRVRAVDVLGHPRRHRDGRRNPPAAAEAKRKAIASYLAYRRDGGENHNLEGRICLDVAQALLSGDSAGAVSLLEQFAADPNLPARFLPFLHALQAVAAGSRDRSLADAEDLGYRMAAEIVFLIETLEKPTSARAATTRS